MHRTASVVAAFLLAVALAGCVQDADAPPSGDSTPPMDPPPTGNQTVNETDNQTEPEAPPVSVRHVTDGENCQAGAALYTVDPATTHAWLPGGYTAADAGEVLGAPFATGRALLGWATVVCDTTEVDEFVLGFSAIVTKQPDVPFELTGNMLDAYIVEWLFPDNEIRSIAQGVGIEPTWAEHALDVQLSGSDTNDDALRSVSQIQTTWQQDDVVLWDGTGYGVAPFNFPVDGFRLWQEVPNGTTYYHAELGIGTEVNPTVFSLGALQCSMDESLSLAQMLDTTSCPPESYGLNILNFGFRDTYFEFHRDVFA